MLREAMADCVNSLERLTDADGAYRITCITQAKRALAATAPPKPYRLSDDLGSFVGLDSEGRLDEWVVADLTEAQRFAIVDALNALAEKENAPVADRVAAKARLDEAMSDLRRSTPEAR